MVRLDYCNEQKIPVSDTPGGQAELLQKAEDVHWFQVHQETPVSASTPPEGLVVFVHCCVC